MGRLPTDADAELSLSVPNMVLGPIDTFDRVSKPASPTISYANSHNASLAFKPNSNFRILASECKPSTLNPFGEVTGECYVLKL